MRLLKSKQQLLYLLLLASIIIGSCAAPAAPVEPMVFPTPTNSMGFYTGASPALFEGNEHQGDYEAIPTIASPFVEDRKPRPTVERTVPTPPPSTSQQQLTSTFVTLPVYAEGLNPNWIIQRNNDLEVNLTSKEAVKEGVVSLAVTPQKGSLLLFSVKESSSEVYLRDNILGLSFWLYSGNQIIEPQDMVVTVLGSNASPYWIANDKSVKNIYDPVFSETRLHYLGINRSIPANTWAKVELWMDERIYDPDYLYVTGFYIKTKDAVSSTFFLDSIELVTYVPEVEGAVATPAPSGQAGGISTPGVRPDQLETVIGVRVDADQASHSISPLIYGVTTVGLDYLEALKIPLNSWGGNPSTRYNWVHGRAWNAGRDFFFKNGNYGVTSGSASDMFVQDSLLAGAEVRLAVPTLGWVAKNDDLGTCSFPLPNGECDDVPKSTCETPFQTADPSRANIKSTARSIQQWIQHLIDRKGFDLRFIAMDNEPELWGFTHYDVHPNCTTYQEILDKYIEYASAIREVAPEAELTGPVTSGWWYYWNSAAGAADKIRHGNQDFLPWFLTKIREHEEKTNERILDVLDIHYYPQGVYNYEDDAETAALRLRSTRSLWDPNYVDESWINTPIYLLPRMKQLIDEHAPGLKLGISEWNWGGETRMSGALAVADVLGIFGREDLYFATYYGFPPEESPSYYAFKMYTNFDGQGGRFGDTSVWSESTDSDIVSSFAALDSSTRKLHLMLINKEPDVESQVQIYLNDFTPAEKARIFQYSGEYPESIVGRNIKVSSDSFLITLPAYSITLIVFDPK